LIGHPTEHWSLQADVSNFTASAAKAFFFCFNILHKVEPDGEVLALLSILNKQMAYQYCLGSHKYAFVCLCLENSVFFKQINACFDTCSETKTFS